MHHRLDALITLSISIALYIGIIFNIMVLDKLIALAVVAIIGFEAFKIAKKINRYVNGEKNTRNRKTSQ